MNDTNPLLAPIHGVSLEDYSAACARMASGVSDDDVCKALGIERAVWEEAGTLWIKRMQEDGTHTVTMLFGQYFGAADAHPKLGGLTGAAVSGKGAETLQKMQQDRYFYHELCGAREAAYEAGLDGAQWIQDNFGVPLGEFQSVAMQWMQYQNRDDMAHTDEILHFINHQQEKKKEYAAKFAADVGGNIADDIEF